MIMCLGSAFFFSIATAGYRDQIAFEESTLARFCDNPIYWAPIQSVVLLAAIYPLARRWIARDDLLVPLLATGLSMLVLFAPWILLMILSAGR